MKASELRVVEHFILANGHKTGAEAVSYAAQIYQNSGSRACFDQW